MPAAGLWLGATCLVVGTTVLLATRRRDSIGLSRTPPG